MDKDSESLTLVRVLILCTLLLVLGSHLLALSEVWNVENSSDIYQNLTRFYFIIINFTFSFSLASKWNNEAIYQKIPQRLISSGRNPLGDPPLKAEMEMFELMLKNLHRPSVPAQSCLTVCNPMDCSPPGSPGHGIIWHEYWEVCHCLLQGIFPTQRSNPHFLRLQYRQVYSLPLRHLGSPDTSAAVRKLGGSILSLLYIYNLTVPDPLYTLNEYLLSK